VSGDRAKVGSDSVGAGILDVSRSKTEHYNIHRDCMPFVKHLSGDVIALYLC
jgi:hypothetical protein